MQALADVHDTADSEAPAGFGVDWIDQLEPSHSSANVPELELPTAVQAFAEVHDTADNPLSDVPAGFGLDWTDQLDPFQTSASVAACPALS